ncbi:hypothetical protein ACIBCN_22805 [Nocardia sp. NPDC051052]
MAAMTWNRNRPAGVVVSMPHLRHRLSVKINIIAVEDVGIGEF